MNACDTPFTIAVNTFARHLSVAKDGSLSRVHRRWRCAVQCSFRASTCSRTENAATRISAPCSKGVGRDVPALLFPCLRCRLVSRPPHVSRHLIRNHGRCHDCRDVRPKSRTTTTKSCVGSWCDEVRECAREQIGYGRGNERDSGRVEVVYALDQLARTAGKSSNVICSQYIVD